MWVARRWRRGCFRRSCWISGFVCCSLTPVDMLVSVACLNRVIKTSRSFGTVDKDSKCSGSRDPQGLGDSGLIENVQWMSAFPGGEADSKRLKIYLQEAITGMKSEVREWNSFEMLNECLLSACRRYTTVILRNLLHFTRTRIDLHHLMCPLHNAWA